MKIETVNRAFRQMLEEGQKSLNAQITMVQQPVKTIVPLVDGDLAQAQLANSLVVLMGIVNGMLSSVMAKEMDRVELMELAGKFNEAMLAANKLLEAWSNMSDDDRNTPIPEGKRKNLYAIEAQHEAEDAMMADRARLMEEFKKQQKEHPGTEIVEPIPGILALKHKSASRVEIPQPEILPS